MKYILGLDLKNELKGENDLEVLVLVDKDTEEVRAHAVKAVTGYRLGLISIEAAKHVEVISGPTEYNLSLGNG